MTWTAPVTRATGDLITAAIWNNEHVNNLQYLHGDAGAAIDLTAGGQALKIGQLQGVNTSPTAQVIYAAETGDTNARCSIEANGTILWSTGGGASDTSLTREAAGAIGVVNVLRPTRTTLAYSASMTPNAAAAEHYLITVTNTSAMTINAPSNPPLNSDTQWLVIEFRNSSGGTMGAITWNAVFKGIGAIANPGNGQKSMWTFRWSGTNWVLVTTSSSGQTFYT
jgi:hypothetical protein